MTATVLNITIEQGADYVTPFPPILDSSGNPVDLTGASAAMQLRTEIGDPTALLTLTTANGGLTGNTIGIWTPDVIEAVTTALLPGCYVYDLKMLLNGVTSFPFRGTVTIPGEVTTIELSPSPPPSGTQVTWGDGTNVTAGDGTNTTWSA